MCNSYKCKACPSLVESSTPSNSGVPFAALATGLGNTGPDEFWLPSISQKRPQLVQVLAGPKLSLQPPRTL